jgi:hypothetical protein
MRLDFIKEGKKNSMSSKSQNDNFPAINQLISRLETNRFLVLNKTEDQYFDDFFFEAIRDK